MKLIKILIIILNFTILNASVYENSEDATTNRWTISDGNLTLTTISNILDTTNQNHFIRLNGEAYASEYRIGNLPQETGAWNNTSEKVLLFDIRNSNGFLIDVIVNTTGGIRFLRYSDIEGDLGIENEYINFGLGFDIADGTWHKVTRDLEADLNKFEPTLQIISVSGLLIRGDTDIDNIELLTTLPVQKEFIVYEDAEDGLTSRWSITDNTPAGATITNVIDVNNRVIELNSSDSYANQYKLSFNNNRNNFNLKWDMQTTEGFIIDIEVITNDGERLLRYTDEPVTTIGKDGEVLYHGLGYTPTNGSWNTIIRDLAKDLIEIEPMNRLVSVNAFLIRAKGRVDNIELFSSPVKVYENAEDGSTNNWQIYSGDSTANISNIYDQNLSSRVISLSGNGYAHQYIIGGDYPDEGTAWHDSKHRHIQWRVKNSDGFIVSVVVNTLNGVRYMNYLDVEDNISSLVSDTLQFGLGTTASDGQWHTYIRDIEADLKKLESSNQLLSVEGVIVTGSILIDDLELFNILHPTQNKAGVALTFDDTTIQSWYNLRPMFSKYGAKATFFVSHFFSLDTAQINQLKTLEAEGSEIGGHTYSHKGVIQDFNNDTSRITEYINDQIKPSYDLMVNAGFNPVSFAYPYGEHQELFDEAVRAYFPYIRLTYDDFQTPLATQKSIYHSSNSSYNLLFGGGIDIDFNNSIAEITDAMIKARKNGEVVVFYAHDVINDPNKAYNILPQTLEKVVENAKNIGLKFYTYKEAYLIGNQN